MTPAVLSVVSSPEFWLSIAFFAVLLISLKPLNRYLTNWGQRRAAQIQQEIDESAELRRKAEKLLTEYKEKTRNKAKERAAILQRAKQEAAYLETEANQKLKERLQKQDEDMAVRLSLVKKQSQRELKDKLLKQLMHQSNQLLLENTRAEETQMADSLTAFFETLESHADLLAPAQHASTSKHKASKSKKL